MAPRMSGTFRETLEVCRETGTGKLFNRRVCSACNPLKSLAAPFPVGNGAKTPRSNGKHQ